MRRDPLVPRRAAVLLGAVVLLMTACTGARPELADEPDVTSSSVPATDEPPPEPATLVAEATVDSIDIYADESSDEVTKEISVDDATSTPGTPIVFLVRRERGERYEVQLPTAPAGEIGWVDRADVEVSAITYRVQVLLTQHRLRVYDDGDQIVFDADVTLGDDDVPEADTYFIKELLQAPDEDGFYGAHAYVLSGFTASAADFEDGDGVVGLHGGASDGELGEDTGEGSIGLTDEAMARLVGELGLQLGTPVQVVG